MTLGKAASFLASTICAATTAAAAGLPISPPFTLVDNRVFVTATLDGKGPYSFLLDTGVDGWAVATSVAHELGIAEGKAERITGAGEARETLHELTLRDVNLAGVSFANQRALSADFSGLDAVIGFRQFDGIAGKPVFDAHVVDLDFARSRVHFFSPAEYSAPAGAKVIPFELYDKAIPAVHGEIAGVKGIFLVDLGDRSSLTLFGPFWRAHHLDRTFAPGIVAITGYGLGGPIKGELVRVPEFTMAGVRVRGIVARLSLQKAGDFDTSALAGSIGTGILKRFNVIFDYPRRRILLRQEPSRDVPDEADRSGLWLGRGGGGFEVLDVVPNGPAARSGIEKGDLVTAIDGVPARQLDLFATREELKSPGRKAYSFSIKDGSHSKIVTVALHDLIPGEPINKSVNCCALIIIDHHRCVIITFRHTAA